MLSWSLVVCTLNRREILEQSLRAAINQTRLPKQIIVVDASDDWELSRHRIFDSVKPGLESVEWIYVGLDQKSLTRQRNIGFKFCNSDVIFFLDDDSFMYPDCADEVMKVYENDTSHMVGGVTTLLADKPPGTSLKQEPSAPPAESQGLTDRLLKPFHKLWDQKELFIPYDGQWHSYDISELSSQASVWSSVLFHGCRMTFRTSVVKEVGGFNEVLIRSAVAEDCDLSYRVSRKYALVGTTGAKIFHLQSDVARINRYLKTILGILNAVVLFLLNTKKENQVSWTVYKFALKRLLIELIRDCGTSQRGFPHARGALKAVRLVPRLLHMDKDQLRSYYVTCQKDLYEKKH